LGFYYRVVRGGIKGILMKYREKKVIGEMPTFLEKKKKEKKGGKSRDKVCQKKKVRGVKRFWE